VRRAALLLALLLIGALPLLAQDDPAATEAPAAEATEATTPTAPAEVSAEICARLAQGAGNEAFFIGLGDAMSAQGDYTRAIIAYTCAIDLNTSYAPAYVSRGLANAVQFNYGQAMDDYNRALELDSTLVSAYNNRGILYTQQANYGLAIADFTIVTSLAPAYAPAYHNRGLVSAAEGNYALAIPDLEQAIALDPDYAAPHAALGAVYLALADASYAEYAARAGRPALPDARDTLTVLQDEATGGTAVWLTLQTPAREVR
jgi:tetratricopeptide (TPR) repeat protein